ncbi:MAG: LysR family transcriptional regulator [Parasutterella sp.]
MKPRENLLSWQVFLTTAVTKNISKTSIELDMDLKTVSRIVKELESDLGFILFDRSCRPFKLTEGAEKILPLAKELLRIKNKIEYKVQDFLLKPTEIRLSLPVNMTRDDLFELMDKYASAHPNLKIRLLNVISLKYANGLRNGANSDTHRCKQLTEHGEERCIKLREVAGFSAVRTIFQIVGPRKILHCLLGK